MLNNDEITEFKKCNDDICHFIDEHVITLLPDDRLFIQEYESGNSKFMFSKISAIRAEILIAIALYYSIFEKQKNIVFLYDTPQISRNAKTYFDYYYSYLPNFMKAPIEKNNLDETLFDNGNKIMFRSKLDSLRSININKLFIDEISDSKILNSIYTLFPIMAHDNKKMIVRDNTSLGGLLNLMHNNEIYYKG